MKEVKGGKVEDGGGHVYCRTKYYMGSGSYMWDEGLCGNNCTPEECEEINQNRASQMGAISAQSYCWNIP